MTNDFPLKKILVICVFTFFVFIIERTVVVTYFEDENPDIATRTLRPVARQSGRKGNLVNSEDKHEGSKKYKFDEWIYRFQNKSGKSFAEVSHYMSDFQPR